MSLRDEVNEVKKETEEFSLQWEMMKEQKKHTKRLFIIVIILVLALIISWISFFAYESQFEMVEETYMTQTQQNIDDSNISGVIN